MEKEEMEIATMKKLNIHKERVDVLENEMETLNTENIQIKSVSDGMFLILGYCFIGKYFTCGR
jgi:hypothetical protein